jgi:hypothetical protein
MYQHDTVPGSNSGLCVARVGGGGGSLIVYIGIPTKFIVVGDSISKTVIESVNDVLTARSVGFSNLQLVSEILLSSGLH